MAPQMARNKSYVQLQIDIFRFFYVKLMEIIEPLFRYSEACPE